MGTILDWLRTETFLITISIALIILILVSLFLIVKLYLINKEYKKFMKKLGKGNNVEEMLKEYLTKVEDVQKTNQEIINYYTKLNENLDNCTQKTGLVRYSAFKDTGSDLSFALALLNNNNDGVVLNGIYSREMSNIYAKPIKNGDSTYTISEEEKQAIEIAIRSKKQ